MRPHDIPHKPTVDNPLSDLAMSCSSPIHQNSDDKVESNNRANKKNSNSHRSSPNNDVSSSSNVVVRRERPSRECTKRAAARLQAAAAAEAEAGAAVKERRKKTVVRRGTLSGNKEEEEEERLNESEEDGEMEEGEERDDGLIKSSNKQQYSKIVTPLVGEPETSQLPRWKLRSMWQLASILNFLHVFRPLLNIKVEFSVEEFETALIMPNSTLASIHIPLLKAIPPVTRMALGHNTWVTVMCRKLRDWWHWVADGELPIFASHGAEVDAYSALDPAVRVVILKAICDIRVEQEDIRNYIDDSLKQGAPLSVFRKERIGGDSHGISYWYEDDPIIGHRLYREIRKVEVKTGKGKSVQPIPNSCYQWETAATNLDEFTDVSEKLFASTNRTEVSVGKKLKINMLPEIEKVHKRKEKLLKKQHREALLLDNMMNIDGLTAGRSLRDRKPVTYRFDEYDRSINEAIEITTKKHPSPEHTARRDATVKHEVTVNGISRRPQFPNVSFKLRSPKSPEYEDDSEEAEPLDRGIRRRQRPQRYSAKEFVEAPFDNSDDDIVGEVVYDDDYVRTRKQQTIESSSSEGDEEYNWDEENLEEEEDEEEDVDDDGDDSSGSGSEDSEQPQRFKKRQVGRTQRASKLRHAGDLQSGLRRSKRATRNSINYRQYELSESDSETKKPEISNNSDEHYHNTEISTEITESEEDNEIPDGEAGQLVHAETGTTLEQANAPEISNPTDQEEEAEDDGRKRSFLDLNELAPGSGFDDGPSSEMKNNSGDGF
ncbi:unnamed protein product [Cuscuta europaea]|uniref:DDT domain-containing protein n=1 Tax=Cuscuta europaea TaxID=41803 RepID=A0A9P0ZB43_CUSEU|nr:unnamed protein product [Cuscuta europaea]